MKNILLFYGNEELIIKSKIRKLIEDLHVSEYNVNIYDMEINDVAMAIHDCLTNPFLDDNKVVILKNPTFLTVGKSPVNHNLEFLANYIANPTDFSYLIIDAGGLKLDETNKTVKLLRKKAEVKESKELSKIEMKGWLKRKFALAGKGISDDAVELFFDRIGWNLLIANNEFVKLANYVSEKDEVTLEDVEKVVSVELETEVFKLTNALETRNKQEMIRIYEDLIKGGTDSLKLLALVAKAIKDTYNVSLMLKKGYKQLDIANTLGISPGRAYYMIKSARNFKPEVLEDLLLKLHEVDYKIKRGMIDKVSGFELFLFAFGK